MTDHIKSAGQSPKSLVLRGIEENNYSKQEILTNFEPSIFDHSGTSSDWKVYDRVSGLIGP